jgi:ADP-heptose:LPS heptosyltransferase
MKKPRILVIKLAALGDMIQAFAAMARIRAAHRDAEITLLTTPPFAALAKASPYVDRVETDGRPKTLGAALAMLWRLRRAGYERVYDLQTSDRSGAYFQALRPFPPEWSGIARGCSHPHNNPDRDRMHTLERQADQLRFAGIWPDAPSAAGTAPPPDLSWLLADATPERQPAHFGLKPPFVLLIPGASPQRPGKRWLAGDYGTLAARLAGLGLDVGVVGGLAEADIAKTVLALAPAAKDLTGRTDLVQLAALGAKAVLAVGNDTGPTHLVAAAGAPTLALFSSESNPALCAPRGRTVRVLAAPTLTELSAETVGAAAEALFRASGAVGSA